MTKKENQKNLSSLQSFADGAMGWIGSIGSLVVHTVLFIGSFLLGLLGIPLDKILLVVTTIVSLEAVYMAIFIQMAVNRNTASLEEVEEDIDEIQKDVDDIQENVDDIQEDVDEIEKDDEQLMYGQKTQGVLSNIESQLKNLIGEIDTIKRERK